MPASPKRAEVRRGGTRPLELICLVIMGLLPSMGDWNRPAARAERVAPGIDPGGVSAYGLRAMPALLPSLRHFLDTRRDRRGHDCPLWIKCYSVKSSRDRQRTNTRKSLRAILNFACAVFHTSVTS